MRTNTSALWDLDAGFGETSTHDADEFLLHEGLDLLAAYRSIEDRNLRLAVKKLVESIASKKRLP